MKKRRILVVSVLAFLLVLSGVCAIVYRSLSRELDSQRAAQRWGAEGDYGFAQLSCYLTESETLTIDDIYSFRQTLDNKFTEASLTAAENAALYTDSFSCFDKLKVSSEYGSGDAFVCAVGGDFFTFHPLHLLSGSYLPKGGAINDLVVLDKELAWMLFGGYELAGMTVYISGQPFTVAGVVEREQDFATEKAYTFGPGLFMSFEAYKNLGEEGISCYEIVMTQPVAGFAENIMKESFKLGGGELVNNSVRSSVKNSYDIVKNFGTRSMRLSSVIYPYWENAARYIDDWCALLFALAVLFAALPVLLIIVLAITSLIRGKDYLQKNVPVWTSEAVDKSRRRRWERKRGAHEKPKTAVK